MSADFEGQRKGERVVLVFRRHILTAGKGMLWLVGCVAVGILPFLIWRAGVAFLVWAGCMVVGLVGWGYAYMLWYFSVYIVTSERLRQVRQKGLFSKSVVDLELSKIENLSYEVPGVLGGIFGYGTLMAQTMVGDLVVSNVRRPEKVYNKLQDAIKKVGNRGEK